MENYKIYGLREIGTNIIRYIGYTKRKLNRRLKAHKTESKKRNTHKDNWLRKINCNVEIVLIEENVKTLNEILEREKYWIKYYKEVLKIDLVNSTDGGEGTIGRTPTEKEKEHLRKINTGKKLTEEHKQKIGKANKGRKLTEEERLIYKNCKRDTYNIKIKNYKRFLSKRGYDVTNLTNEEVEKLRLEIKQTEINQKNKIKQELDNKKFLKEEEKRLRIQKRKDDIEDRKRLKKELKQKNLKDKIEKGLIREFIDKNGKTKYVPIPTAEDIERNRKANIGKKSSEESIRKRVESSKKTREAKGKDFYKLSDEKKENLRQKNLGKKQSKETIEKRSPKLRGENSGTAKLKNQDILEIRRLVNENVKTRKEVAKMYNMDYTTICKIINKQLWGHI